MQNIPFFQPGQLQVADINTVKQDEGIVPYLSVHLNSTYSGLFELSPKSGAKPLFHLSESALYVICFYREAVCVQIAAPKAIKPYYY